MTELCIHTANLFYLVSFLGRDMLWLRTLTCCGLVLGIVFFTTCQPKPLYGPTIWHGVFLVINGVQIWRLVQDRRRLTLNEEQAAAAERAFRHLDRDELLTLLTHVMHDNPRRVRSIRRTAHQPLSAEEEVLRDIALSRLSRKELLNLLTRNMWGTVKRLNPGRWRRSPRKGAANFGKEQS